ncbi:NUDIX domain-containing protein [Mycobacterium sp. AMU20-3851]|uniref:NUDIX hydrolase n=1 Tax=Mycobacterium sp. AMU20-3851 TaxID=3122055 RepID=UPI003754B273
MDKNTHRDNSGKSLTDYPRPSVAVDTAVLTLGSERQLLVLQVPRPAVRGWALPGTFMRPGEILADAVNRSLAEKAGVRELRPRQLHVFDALDRDDRGWVLSVAHVAVVGPEILAERFDATRLVPVTAPGRLVYDHREIIALAVDDVCARYAAAPDPDRLLGESFTLRDLRLVHEAIVGQELQRDTFRRAMEPHLESTGERVAAGRGRPAELFRRA